MKEAQEVKLLWHPPSNENARAELIAYYRGQRKGAMLLLVLAVGMGIWTISSGDLDIEPPVFGLFVGIVHFHYTADIIGSQSASSDVLEGQTSHVAVVDRPVTGSALRCRFTVGDGSLEEFVAALGRSIPEDKGWSTLGEMIHLRVWLMAPGFHEWVEMSGSSTITTNLPVEVTVERYVHGGEDGSYLVPFVSPGRYSLWARDHDAGWCSIGPVTVSTGVTEVADVQMRKGATVTGVLHADWEPRDAKEYKVVATDSGGIRTMWGIGHVDMYGLNGETYRLGHLWPGRWRVDLVADGEVLRSTNVVVGGTETIRADLIAPPARDALGDTVHLPEDWKRIDVSVGSGSCWGESVSRYLAIEKAEDGGRITLARQDAPEFAHPRSVTEEELRDICDRLVSYCTTFRRQGKRLPNHWLLYRVEVIRERGDEPEVLSEGPMVVQSAASQAFRKWLRSLHADASEVPGAMLPSNER